MAIWFPPLIPLKFLWLRSPVTSSLAYLTVHYQSFSEQLTLLPSHSLRKCLYLCFPNSPGFVQPSLNSFFVEIPFSNFPIQCWCFSGFPILILFSLFRNYIQTVSYRLNITTGQTHIQYVQKSPTTFSSN